MSEIGSNSNKDYQDIKKTIKDIASDVKKTTEKEMKSTSVDAGQINVETSGLEKKIEIGVVEAVKEGAKKAQNKIKDIKLQPNITFDPNDIDFSKMKKQLDNAIAKSMKDNSPKANKKILDIMKTADDYGRSFGKKYQDYRDSIQGQVQGYSPKNIAKDYVDSAKVIEAQNKVWDNAVQHMNEYIEAAKKVSDVNRNILPRGDERISGYVNPKDVTKRSNYTNVTQKSLKNALDEYTTNSSQHNFDALAAYTNALGNMTKAEEIFGAKHKELFTQVKEYIDKAKSSVKDFGSSTQSFGKVLDTLNLKNVDPEKLKEFKDVLSAQGVNAGLDYLKTKLGMEIPQAMKDAFSEEPIIAWVAEMERAEQVSDETRQKIQEAMNISKNADAGSSVKMWEEELERASKVSAENATAQNEKIAQSYKELTQLASEYYKYKEKSERGATNGSENTYLAELSQKWEKATQVVREYEIAVEGSAESIKKAQQAKIGFDEKDSKAARDFASNLSNMEEKLSKLAKTKKYTSGLTEDLQKAAAEIKEFNSQPIELNTDDAIQSIARLTSSYDELIQRTQVADEKLAAQDTIAKLNAQIDEFTQKNSKMGAVYRERFNSLKLDFDTEQTLPRVKEIVAEFNKLRGEIYQANLTGKSFFENLGSRIKQMSTNFIAMYFSLYDIVRYARTAINTIKDLDYALVDLRKTTTMSASELNEFYYNSNDVAKQMGTTTKEIISQAASWSRLGYSSKDAATEMAALSSKFAAISPGMTLDQSTDGLVSTMKAFHIEVDNTERDIMDNVNRIGNTFATSNTEIMEMLKRSSAAMSEANNTLEQTIALESAAVQVTRNAETTGTAFRTISMRIRGKQSLPPYTVMYMLCA